MLNYRTEKNGFTLIELMVAVAIVGILAAIAIPSYQDSMRKSRRADAKAALLSFANAMERRFTETNTYCNTAQWGADTCGDGGFADSDGKPDKTVFAPSAETDEYYEFTLKNVQQNFYTLVATPDLAGIQNGDGVLELDSTGARRWDKNNNFDATEAGENTWD